jgi:Asp-tRNA(Asn)/Glu-tRNA(Gln) amidotransferase A subunit family amidase
MIKLQNRPNTNFQKIEADFKFLTNEEIKLYYIDFIKSYINLNTKFGFNQSFDEEFIFNQINIIKKNNELDFIPFGIKDVINTKILPTSMGSKIWEGFKAGNNARVVDNIINNGGIIFSKTTTAEFAVHFISPGQTKNPYNLNHITGTSSSGSAVAVASGALPIAIGTQTAGSIIRPASFCGIYGFKPTFGLIDRTGVLKTNDTFDTIGLLSADIYGIKKTINYIFQKGKDYPNSNILNDNYLKYKNKNKVKIGFLENTLKVFKNFDHFIMNDFNFFKNNISSKYNLYDINNIDFLNDIHQIHEDMYAKSLSYYFKNEIKQHESVSDIMVEMIKKGEKISAEHYVKISKFQPIITKKMNDLFEKMDFIIVPSTATPAPKIGDFEKDDTCLIWTYFGYPAISIPLFIDDESGLPFGLQIIAKKYDDFSLLNFAENIIDVF